MALITSDWHCGPRLHTMALITSDHSIVEHDCTQWHNGPNHLGLWHCSPPLPRVSVPAAARTFIAPTRFPPAGAPRDPRAPWWGCPGPTCQPRLLPSAPLLCSPLLLSSSSPLLLSSPLLCSSSLLLSSPLLPSAPLFSSSRFSGSQTNMPAWLVFGGHELAC